MNKHKIEDYKMSAVKYYLKNSISLERVCEIFDCKKQSLFSVLLVRWCVLGKKLKFFFINVIN